ncbi:AzlD domain-containing protein [Salinicoccus kekensis]|uniref:Branched-subunit amino acid transport protein AzlD n=1 Tax=Salinicoccus kekensis TaxID=714307 RepID=A0A285UM93_9STAP|nr:AzlD domain-containing protein [Salinicoccus kekensis]SOC42807.1 branched-subunit amino acid transport protein AzlD [Salinicoccus kekensis]
MILLILALFAATIITRILPAFFVGGLNFPHWLVTLLNYIPYAALGVLIFPGLLTAVETPLQGILGGLFAMVLAILRVPLFFVVFGAIIFVYFLI